MIGNQPVCNIKPVMCYRFILGFSQNLKWSSGFTRLLIKLYPVIIYSIVNISFVCCELSSVVSFQSYLTLGENSLNVLVALLCKDDYLNTYFTYLHTIDGFPGTKQAYQKLQFFSVLVITFSFGFRLCSSATLLYSFPEIVFTTQAIELYILTFTFLANDMVRVAMVLCFGLLYYRIKVFKRAIETTDFNDSLRNRSAINKLILMYEVLVDTFRKLGRQLKYLVPI